MPRYCLSLTFKFILLSFGISLLFCCLVDAESPPWWDDPIREDSRHYFFAASGNSETSKEDAYQQAQNFAVEQIIHRIGGGQSEVKDYLSARIRGTSVHARHEARVGRIHYCWIILRYPKNELYALRELAVGGDVRYREAVRLAGEHRWKQALTVIDELEKTYPLGMQPLFRTEKAILLAGQCLEALEKYQAAKETYERLLNIVSDPTVRRQARNALEHVRRKLPDHVMPQATALSRSSVMEKLAAQDYISALSMAELLLERDGHTPEALELVGRAYAGIGNLDHAAEYYNMAAYSASPQSFRLFRIKAQEISSQLFSVTCARLLHENATGKKTWAFIFDPSISDDPEIASFLRSFQSRILQAAPSDLEYTDWFLFEEWLRASGKRLADFKDMNSLLAASLEAGLKPIDLLLFVTKAAGTSNERVAVKGRLYGAENHAIAMVDVVIGQAPTSAETVENPVDIVARGRLEEAAYLFEKMGNKEYATLLRKTADLKRSSNNLGRGATVTPDVRLEFERSMLAIFSSVPLWLPESEINKQISELLLGSMRRWIDEVEANFSYLGGNKRDLIAILNRCRELDTAMNMAPMEQRHTNAVQAYATYAEVYRTYPSWALPRGIWIDANSGLSMEIEDRLFEIPFHLIPAGKGFFGDARKGKLISQGPFYIQTRETTNKDFLRFCDDTGWQIPEHMIRNTGFAHPLQPVTHVSYLDAKRYAQWLGSKFRDKQKPNKWRCALPTEAQWEFSARSAFPFDYPWGLGVQPITSLSQRKLGVPEDAANLTEDISITGVIGLAGNIREWCRDGWTENPSDTIAPGAKNPVLGVRWDSRKVVKGGCYYSEKPDEFRVFARRAFEPDNVERSIGFRVVVNIETKE